MNQPNASDEQSIVRMSKAIDTSLCSLIVSSLDRPARLGAGGAGVTPE